MNLNRPFFLKIDCFDLWAPPVWTVNQVQDKTQSRNVLSTTYLEPELTGPKTNVGPWQMTTHPYAHTHSWWQNTPEHRWWQALMSYGEESLGDLWLPKLAASIVFVYLGTWCHCFFLTPKESLDFENKETEFKATFYPVARAILWP